MPVQTIMPSPLLPTSAQTFECFRIYYQLTNLFLDISLVRLDERTSNIFILAGENLLVTGTEGSGTVKALLVYDGDEESGSRARVNGQSPKNELIHEAHRLDFFLSSRNT